MVAMIYSFVKIKKKCIRPVVILPSRKGSNSFFFSFLFQPGVHIECEMGFSENYHYRLVPHVLLLDLQNIFNP
jgi:hypothetical protein